jgi:hypothetical protein
MRRRPSRASRVDVAAGGPLRAPARWPGECRRAGPRRCRKHRPGAAAEAAHLHTAIYETEEERDDLHRIPEHVLEMRGRPMGAACPIDDRVQLTRSMRQERNDRQERRSLSMTISTIRCDMAAASLSSSFARGATLAPAWHDPLNHWPPCAISPPPISFGAICCDPERGPHRSIYVDPP